MHNKKLRQICAGCAAALALTIVAGPISAFAATVTPATGAALNIDPTVEDDPATADVNEAYTGTAIDVWAFTENETVYSVDVEWGAMTFQYEGSSWDPVNHTSKPGDGWVVYDSVNNEKIDAAQDAINKVTITNHSNAPVNAKLTYTANTTGTDYSSIGGTFANSTNAATENVKATWDDTNKAFKLETAATDAAGAAVAEGAEGAEAVGNVYFTPSSTAGNEPSDITKWTKIGKITVALSAEDPTTPATPTP